MGGRPAAQMAHGVSQRHDWAQFMIASPRASSGVEITHGTEGTRLLRFVALIATALVPSLSASTAGARATASHPTIALVHGAFASPAGCARCPTHCKDSYRTATRPVGLATVAAEVTINRRERGYPPGCSWHMSCFPSLPFVIDDPQLSPEDFAHDLTPHRSATR